MERLFPFMGVAPRPIARLGGGGPPLAHRRRIPLRAHTMTSLTNDVTPRQRRTLRGARDPLALAAAFLRATRPFDRTRGSLGAPWVLG
jgi:hypothetical protein